MLDPPHVLCVVAAIAGCGRPSAPVTESGLETPVRRGENAGSTLVNDFVVRRLELALAFEPGQSGDRRRRLRIPLDTAWNTDRLRAVAFVQDATTLEIYAAAADR